MDLRSNEYVVKPVGCHAKQQRKKIGLWCKGKKLDCGVDSFLTCFFIMAGEPRGL